MTGKPVRQPIDNPDRAWRLARAIVSDVNMYNESKIVQGIEADNLFTLMDAEIQEGRELYRSRVTEEVFKLNIYDRVLVDKMIKSKAHVKSKLW
jgi:hypothetical protein